MEAPGGFSHSLAPLCNPPPPLAHTEIEVAHPPPIRRADGAEDPFFRPFFCGLDFIPKPSSQFQIQGAISGIIFEALRATSLQASSLPRPEGLRLFGFPHPFP